MEASSRYFFRLPPDNSKARAAPTKQIATLLLFPLTPSSSNRCICGERNFITLSLLVSQKAFRGALLQTGSTPRTFRLPKPMMKQTIAPPRNASTATQTRHKENKRISGSWYYLQLQAAELIQEQETRNLHSSSAIIEKETIRNRDKNHNNNKIAEDWLIVWLFHKAPKQQT